MSPPNCWAVKDGTRLAQCWRRSVEPVPLGQGVAAQHRDGRGAVGGRHALHAGTGDDHGFVAGALGLLLPKAGAIKANMAKADTDAPTSKEFFRLVTVIFPISG